MQGDWSWGALELVRLFAVQKLALDLGAGADDWLQWLDLAGFLYVLDSHRASVAVR